MPDPRLELSYQELLYAATALRAEVARGDQAAADPAYGSTRGLFSGERGQDAGAGSEIRPGRGWGPASNGRKTHGYPELAALQSLSSPPLLAFRSASCATSRSTAKWVTPWRTFTTWPAGHPYITRSPSSRTGLSSMSHSGQNAFAPATPPRYQRHRHRSPMNSSVRYDS